MPREPTIGKGNFYQLQILQKHLEIIRTISRKELTTTINGREDFVEVSYKEAWEIKGLPQTSKSLHTKARSLIVHGM